MKYGRIIARNCLFIHSQVDRVRREKLRRKREEEEAATGKSESSRIVEVTDEEAEKITRENAQTKVRRDWTSEETPSILV